MLLRVYFESGEFGAFLIECWSACRQGESDDGGDDDRCLLFFFFFFTRMRMKSSPSFVAGLVLNTGDVGM